MRLLSALSVTFVMSVCASLPAQAYCVEVAFFDDRGDLIMSDGLIVGMMVGEAPIFSAPNIPPHREAKAARKVACPLELVNQVRDLFNRSCTSEQARSQATVTNKTSLEIVMKRCGELQQALGTSG